LGCARKRSWAIGHITHAWERTPLARGPRRGAGGAEDDAMNRRVLFWLLWTLVAVGTMFVQLAQRFSQAVRDPADLP